ERQENVAPEEACLELADPDEGTAAVRRKLLRSSPRR
ncbi:hypothetical protein Tco_0616862, partial [Tanacetum coccineum]